MVDCEDRRERRVLEFIVPILCPEKPTRATVTVANTIFGSLSGDRPVDWGLVIRDVVTKLMVGVGRGKSTPICPYVFHLYKSVGELTEEEEVEYEAAEVML